MINKDYLTQWLGENATQEYQKFFYKDGLMYATNKFVLFIVKSFYDKRLEGCVANFEDVVLEENFFDYEKLFRIINHEQYKNVRVDYSLMKKILETHGEFAYVKIGDVDFEFKKNTVFKCIVDFMEHTGEKTMWVTKNNKMVYIKHNEEYGFFMPYLFTNIDPKIKYDTLDLKYEQHKLF